jgi:exopolyphosphatase/guanosine-5'-triphosphate,3'-diphosphate pyrophosphatase
VTTSAAIDIGSNSVHLLVAEVGPDDSLEILADESLQLGLGRVVHHQGRMGAAARRAAVETVSGLADRARDLGADRVLLMGTQPLRRAADRSLLVRSIRDSEGLDLVVLTHDQEATLTLLGVSIGRAVDGPLLVMDVGGGSSEVIVVVPGMAPVVGAFPVGSARLSEMVVAHDPPTAAEVAELRVRARALVEPLPSGSPVLGIVSGGSGTNISRLLGRDRTTRVTMDDLEAALALLATRPAASLALETGLTERRVHQLAAGIAIVEALMDRYRLSVTEVSDAGLREGAVLVEARFGADWVANLPGAVTIQHHGAAGNPLDGA